MTSVSTILVVAFGAALLASPHALGGCGNSVVEAGEDCDDGSTENGGTNSCCTSSCTFSGKSPDVIVGDIVGTTRWGAAGGITAFSFGTTSCNIGSCWLNWISSTAEHPVIGQNMFRLKDGRFEQIGQSWLKHGFTALAGGVCGTCTPPPNGSHLGVNCSDPYSRTLNGDQTRLGPKENVDPNTGVFLFPDARETTTGNAIFKRLQVHNADLDPALNAGALYFVEGQYVTHDDTTAQNHPNNASYRPVTVSAISGIFTLGLTGATVQQKPGSQAWKATDPSVTQTVVGAAGGQFYVSAKATSLGGGQYHYEYAVQNLNNERAGQAFTVPIPPGTVVTNVGFHDVDYHSGEVFDGTDWTATVTASSVSWATTTYAVNPNANALRWGTLYNFRFDANQAPGTASVVIDLFKPGSPTTASVSTVTPFTCGAAPSEVDNGVEISQDQSQGISTISWHQAAGSLWSDVLRGLVSGLPVGPGGADEVCLDSGNVGTSTLDGTDPDPGEAFWYLVKGTSSCGAGPYGDQVQDGVPSPRVSATCP